MHASGTLARLALALLCLGSAPALADDTDTDDTDTDDTDTDVGDTGDPFRGPLYAAHDLAGEDGGSNCTDGTALGWLALPLVLGLPALRRR